tara:strand:- start:612 stop:2699 length:2088 start_codon:yes stop_codon:yes gene_type:complete
MVRESSLGGFSNFLGRDGFKWFAAQVAPLDAQEEQLVQGEGWAQRYKLRIAGHHPFSEEITNKDLPWGQALLPTTAGAGGANYAQSTLIQQGDIVFGFFLDGDEAQMPMILGQFPRTQYVANGDYSSAFAPFGAYTSNTEKNGRVPESENNEQAKHSQPTPTTQGKKKDQVGAGARQLTADTCQTNPITEMASVVENLAGRVEALALAGSNLKNEVRLAADIIEIQANRFVGTLIEKLFDKFEILGQAGLEALYRLVYAKVYAATQSGIAAHLAGVAAETAMLAPTAFLQEAIGCVANKVVEGLAGTVEDLLLDLMESGRNYAGCMGAQFTGAFVKTIIDAIEDGMKGPLSGVAKIIAPGFAIADFLTSVAGNLNTIASFLDCAQSNKGKCPQDKEYVVGGSSQERGEDPFDYVMNALKISKGAASLTNDFERKWGKWDIFGDGDLLSDSASNYIIPGGCYGGPPRNCSGPYIEIFGGEGSGATAEAIMGYFVDNTEGLGGVLGGVQRTGSILGAKMTNFGSGYRYPPMVNFRDKCNLGFGGVGKAVLGGPNGDQVVAIVMLSTGEGYPELPPVATPITDGITNIIVANPGTGYQPGDRVVLPGISDSGLVEIKLPEGPDIEGDVGIGTSPIFDIVVDDDGGITDVKVLNILRFNEELPTLRVLSATGSGAVLRPTFGPLPTDGQVGIVSVTDCV